MSDTNFQDLTSEELAEAAGGCRRWGGCGWGGWGSWGNGCGRGNGPIVINNVPNGIPGYPGGIPGAPFPPAVPGYGVPGYGVPGGWHW